jgi:hypothetical protein
VTAHFCDAPIASLSESGASATIPRSMHKSLVAAVAATAVLLIIMSTTGLTQAPVVPFRLGTGHGMWNTTSGDIDGDGEDELIIATLDGGRVTELTFKTPLYIVSVIDNKVVDRSTELFDTRPTSWNTTLTTGDFDADGRLDLLLCDRGRNVGPNPPPGDVLIDGVRGAQNEVLLNRGGKLRLTDGFPRMVTSSWGCSSGDVDRSGRATIAMMSWYAKGVDAAFLLTWDGASRFIQTRTLPAPTGSGGWGATATADFDGNGFADISGGRQVFWNGPGVLTGSQPLAQSVVEKQGYTFWRSTLTADFTGDGLPDLVKLTNLTEPSLAELRFAMYAGDRRLGLVEKIDAFPAITAYGYNDFGSRAVAVDLNFDGALDIAGHGWTEGQGCRPRAPGEICVPMSGGERPPTAVWLNDGTGRFRQARWSDSIQSFATCDRSEAYFLPTRDPKKYNVIWGNCGNGYVGRSVTEARPLIFTQ